MLKKNFNRFLIIALLLYTGTAIAQPDFEWLPGTVKLNVKVQALGDGETFVLQPIGSSSERYISTQLPDMLKKDGLPLYIKGQKGKIPPNFRMMGTPFKIHCIRIAKADAKQFGITTTQFKFKQ